MLVLCAGSVLQINPVNLQNAHLDKTDPAVHVAGSLAKCRHWANSLDMSRPSLHKAKDNNLDLDFISRLLTQESGSRGAARPAVPDANLASKNSE